MGGISIFGIDPVQQFYELGFVLLILLLLALIWFNWKKVVFLFTDDDRIHWSWFDPINYFCFRCCNMCTGEWTRCFTGCSCWSMCGLQHQNLVKALAQLCGVQTMSVEIKNMVVGDLPYEYSVGDFYLSVECDRNPPLVTSLAETQPGKVVHFPEVITLQIRRNPLERRLRLTVKELDVYGHKDLCEVWLNPQDVIDWADDDAVVVQREDDGRWYQRMTNVDMSQGFFRNLIKQWCKCCKRCMGQKKGLKSAQGAGDFDSDDSDTGLMEDRTKVFKTRVKRFQMRPINNEFEQVTPPWICMEFSFPTEARRLDSIYKSSTSKAKIRTWDSRTSHGGYTTMSAGIAQDNEFLEADVADFKDQHVLLDEHGAPVKEPKESDLAAITRTRSCIVGFHACYTCVATVVVTVWCFMRFYVGSCYNQYRVYTMARLHDVHFPLSSTTYLAVERACKATVRGTGAKEGDPCRPNATDILDTCTNNTLSDGQRPQVFKIFLKQFFNLDLRHGIPCIGHMPSLNPFAELAAMAQAASWNSNFTFHQPGFELCEFRDYLVEEVDPPIIEEKPWLGRNSLLVLVIILIIGCAMKLVLNWILRRWKEHLQRKNHFQHATSKGATRNFTPSKRGETRQTTGTR
mmetsp:Transcript_8389/g.18319  ORF Transcript_8389/g.18319 Transcript_8389/m.18319 type:complete len:630 (+) Transcript_8389:103-1992(+)|eukprot:CAMPEP_0170605346 /NCGR_PEP_ID=MMETSP0224-20130122/19924_1 /TAXON_ID=285029 /ORGANISM="Togula jolla, Strain CCCM 725" /LENGTH=629 /DNA_ID=CAMNT_0010930343 /DNA_START=102 /DNA_END=1991 /DNA_ORIENTATION=+